MSLDRILLIYPDTHNRGSGLLAPLSLVYVATPLQGHFDVEIVDHRVDPDWRVTVARALASRDVACVGISTMTGPQLRGAIESAQLVRQCHPTVPIVWGGVHPSLLPEQTVADDLVDIVVIGDGEETFRELAFALRDGGDLSSVRGIAFKDGGRIVRTPARPLFPLSSLARPAYDLIDAEKYKSTPAWSGETSLPVITSRGCPYRCAYCYITEFSGTRWSALSPRQVVAHFRDVVGTYHLGGLFLLDDHFFVDLKRVRDACRLILESGLRIKIYNANCRVDAVCHMDDETLALLKEAGFDQIFLGVESGSDAVLKRIRKDLTVRQVLAADDRLQLAGIRSFYSFMAGFPDETVDEVKETLVLMNHLLKRNPEAIVYKLQLFTPFPGTELYHRSVERGMRFPDTLAGWADYHYDTLNYDGFPADHRRFLEDFHCYSEFLDPKLSRDRSRSLRRVAGLYSAVLRYRLDHGLYAFRYELGPLRAGRKLRQRT